MLNGDYDKFTYSFIMETQMIQIKRIITDKTRKYLRKPVKSVLSAFYYEICHTTVKY